MKLIKKKAEFVGYVVYSVGDIQEWRCTEWRCPDKDCGMSVMEEYKCCPYCGRRLKFGGGSIKWFDDKQLVKNKGEET